MCCIEIIRSITLRPININIGLTNPNFSMELRISNESELNVTTKINCWNGGIVSITMISKPIVINQKIKVSSKTSWIFCPIWDTVTFVWAYAWSNFEATKFVYVSTTLNTQWTSLNTFGIRFLYLPHNTNWQKIDKGFSFVNATMV